MFSPKLITSKMSNARKHSTPPSTFATRKEMQPNNVGRNNDGGLRRTRGEWVVGDFDPYK
jgi:hypothetical protein